MTSSKALCAAAGCAAIAFSACSTMDETKFAALEKRVDSLEKIEKDKHAAKAFQEIVKGKIAKAIARREMEFKKDPERFKAADKLYMEAQKSPESSRELYMKLVNEYPGFNSTGCALCTVACGSGGDEQIALCRKAIAEYSDCYYGNGVQVGVYARFWLAKWLWHDGKKAEAQALVDEIKTLYPDAVAPENKLMDIYLDTKTW